MCIRGVCRSDYYLCVLLWNTLLRCRGVTSAVYPATTGKHSMLPTWLVQLTTSTVDWLELRLNVPLQIVYFGHTFPSQSLGQYGRNESRRRHRDPVSLALLARFQTKIIIRLKYTDKHKKQSNELFPHIRWMTNLVVAAVHWFHVTAHGSVTRRRITRLLQSCETNRSLITEWQVTSAPRRQ